MFVRSIIPFNHDVHGGDGSGFELESGTFF
jgi:hypothetical protein